VTEPPVSGPTDKPADVLDRAGRWLAESLDGFRWVTSSRELRRRDGVDVRLHLQPSRYSSAGGAVWATPRLAISDGQRRVFNSMLVNLSPRWISVECSGAPHAPVESQAISLPDFLTDLQHHVLPVVELFHDPAEAAASLPSQWLGMVGAGTIEWAIAHDEPDAAALLVRRHMERPLVGQQTWESRLSRFSDGWHADARPAAHEEMQTLGWLSRQHDLVAPDTLRVPELVEPPHSRRGLLRLLRRRPE